jgi:hypothetical protein
MNLKRLKPLIYKKVLKGTPSECWFWLGTVRLSGYGQFTVNGKAFVAHRLIFEIEHGEIPPGKILLRTCVHRECVNPSHMKIKSRGMWEKREKVESKFRGSTVRFRKNEIKEWL